MLFYSLTLLSLWSLACLARLCSNIQFNRRGWFWSAGLFVGFLLFIGGSRGGRRGCRLEIVYIVIVHRYLEPSVSRVGKLLFTLQLLFSWSWLELQSRGSHAVGRGGRLVCRGLSHGNVGLGFCIIQQSELQLLAGWFGWLVFPRYNMIQSSVPGGTARWKGWQLYCVLFSVLLILGSV